MKATTGIRNAGIMIAAASIVLLAMPSVAAEDDAFTADTNTIGCDIVEVWIVGVEPHPNNIHDCTDDVEDCIEELEDCLIP